MSDTYKRLVDCVASAHRNVNDAATLDRDLQIATDLTDDLIHTRDASLSSAVLDNIRVMLYDVQCFSHEPMLAKMLLTKLRKRLKVQCV